MARITSAIIIGDGCDQEDWDRLLGSIENYVDHLYVGYTGSKDEFPYGEYPWVTSRRVGWEQDFSLARNRNLDMIPRGEYDWIIWLDSDDSLEDGDKLQDAIAEADENTQIIFLPYIYASDENGKPLVTQWRERMFRSDVQATWQYMIHEICHFPPGTQAKRVENKTFVKHWRHSFGQDNIEARRRNRDMLALAQQRYPEEPRYVMYLAHEVYAEAQYKRSVNQLGESEAAFRSAIKLYELFLQGQNNPNSDDPYGVVCRIAEITAILGDYNRSVDHYLQGVKMRPTYPEAYIGVAENFLNNKQYALARDWANLCLTSTRRDHLDTFNAVDTDAITHAPYYIRGVARMELGDEANAIEDLETALVGNPGHEDINRRLEILRSDLGKTKTDERKPRFGSNPDKSIAFLVPPLFEPWHPALSKQQGSGGAEQCIVEIAQRFAEDGYRAVVFGTPGRNRGVYEGVEYWDTIDDFAAVEPFTYLVGSRQPGLFHGPMNAKHRLLWMHDVNPGPVQSNMQNRTGWDEADGVIALTNWHSQHLQKMYPMIKPSKMLIIPNGYDDDLFVPSQEKNRHSFVYASSPDRGVDVLLSLWPEIKKRWPQSKLDIFYGWTGIDKIIDTAGQNHPISRFKYHVMKLVEAVNEDGSVTWHDRVNRQELADFYQEAYLWLYPTYFLETFCITALEMQASGVIPIATSCGALPETVAADYLLVEGHANNKTYRRQFLDAMGTVMDTDAVADQAREEGYEHVKNYTWDQAYATWRVALEIEPKVSVALA